MIKVPRFYTQRGKETATAPPLTASKPPVVVVRTGKPSPEIIRPKKDSPVNTQQHNQSEDFQENFPQFSNPITIDPGFLGNSNLKAINVEESRSADELFEERVGEIDYELNRFDPKMTIAAKNIVVTGKENLLATLSLKDGQPVHINTSRAQQPQLSPPLPREPLSAISENIIQPTERGATWKRLSRIGMETDIEMEDILGEKRRVDSSEDQSELPKRRRVS